MTDIKTMTDIDVFDFEVSEGFVIDNAAKADWAASVILNEQAQTEVYEQACDMMIDELRAKESQAARGNASENGRTKTNADGVDGYSANQESKEQREYQASHRHDTACVRNTDVRARPRY